MKEVFIRGSNIDMYVGIDSLYSKSCNGIVSFDVCNFNNRDFEREKSGF